MKVTLAHVIKIIFSLIIIASVLYWLIMESSSVIILQCFTWLSFAIIALFVGIQLSEIKTAIRLLIGIGTFIILAVGYIVCAKFSPDITIYIHIIMTFILICFVLIIFLSNNSPSKIINQEDKITISKSSAIINLIIRGRIDNEEQLELFYDNLGKVPFSFHTFVSAIYDLAQRDSEMSDDNWKKIQSLTYPIICKEKEKVKFHDIKGTEKEFIQTIYNICKNSDFNDKSRLLDNLNSTYKSILENQKRFEIEQRRNSQSLFISWIGIIVTVILSLLSILISLYDVSFNASAS